MLKSDDTTDEMQERQIVVGLLFPADEDAAKAVHPRVRALNDPPSGFVARFLFDGPRLFATGANVSGEAELLH